MTRIWFKEASSQPGCNKLLDITAFVFMCNHTKWAVKQNKSNKKWKAIFTVVRLHSSRGRRFFWSCQEILKWESTRNKASYICVRHIPLGLSFTSTLGFPFPNYRVSWEINSPSTHVKEWPIGKMWQAKSQPNVQATKMGSLTAY